MLQLSAPGKSTVSIPRCVITSHRERELERFCSNVLRVHCTEHELIRQTGDCLEIILSVMEYLRLLDYVSSTLFFFIYGLV